MNKKSSPSRQRKLAKGARLRLAARPPRSSTPDTAVPPGRISFPVVGFGASAGGLEALEQFLTMPRSAIETALADIVAPVDDLPGRILAYLKRVHIVPTPERALEGQLRAKHGVLERHVAEQSAKPARARARGKPGTAERKALQKSSEKPAGPGKA